MSELLQLDQRLFQEAEKLISNSSTLVSDNAKKDGTLSAKLLSLLFCNNQTVQNNSRNILIGAFSNSANHKALCEQPGAIPMLLTQLEDANELLVRSAAYSFSTASFSTDPTILDCLISSHVEKGLTKAIENALPDKHDIIEFSTRAIGLITSKKPDIIDSISSLNTIEVILQAVEHSASATDNNETHIKVITNALLAIAQISAANHAKKAIILQKIVRNGNNNNGIDIITKCFKHKQAPNISSYSLSTLLQLTALEEGRNAICKHNSCISTLITYLDVADNITDATLKAKAEQDLQRALKIITNLCFDKQGREEIVANPAQPLSSFFQMLQNIVDTKSKNTTDVTTLAILKLLANLLSDSDEYDQLTKFNAVTTLRNLYSYFDSTAPKSDYTPHILVHIVKIIANVVSNDEIQNQVNEEGKSGFLVDILANSKILQVQIEAVRAISNITNFYDGIRNDLLEKDIAKHLTLRIQSPGIPVDLKAQCFRAFINLALSPTGTETIVKDSRLLKELIALIQDKSACSNALKPEEKEKLALLSSSLLVNLSSTTESIATITKEVELKNVVSMLNASNTSPTLKFQAAKLLSNLATSGRNRKWLHENNKVNDVQKYYDSLASNATAVAGKIGTAEIKSQLSVALQNLAFPYDEHYADKDAPLPEIQEIEETPRGTTGDEEDYDDSEPEVSEEEIAAAKKAAEEHAKALEQKKAEEAAKRQQLLAQQKALEEKKLAAEEERLRLEKEQRKLEEERKRLEQQKAEEEKQERIRLEEIKRKKEEEMQKEREKIQQEKERLLEQERKRKEEHQKKIEEQKRLEEEAKIKREQEEKRIALEQERLMREKAEAEQEAQRLAELRKKREEERQKRIAQLEKEQKEREVRLKEEQERLEKARKEKAEQLEKERLQFEKEKIEKEEKERLAKEKAEQEQITKETNEAKEAAEKELKAKQELLAAKQLEIEKKKAAIELQQQKAAKKEKAIQKYERRAKRIAKAEKKQKRKSKKQKADTQVTSNSNATEAPKVSIEEVQKKQKRLQRRTKKIRNTITLEESSLTLLLADMEKIEKEIALANKSKDQVPTDSKKEEEETMLLQKKKEEEEQQQAMRLAEQEKLCAQQKKEAEQQRLKLQKEQEEMENLLKEEEEKEKLLREEEEKRLQELEKIRKERELESKRLQEEQDKQKQLQKEQSLKKLQATEVDLEDDEESKLALQKLAEQEKELQLKMEKEKAEQEKLQKQEEERRRIERETELKERTERIQQAIALAAEEKKKQAQEEQQLKEQQKQLQKIEEEVKVVETTKQEAETRTRKITATFQRQRSRAASINVPTNTSSTSDTEKKEKMQKRRTNIAREIYDTEKSFTTSLKTLIDKFIMPLKELARSEKPLISYVQIKSIFSNVEMIVNFNSILEEAIENRLKQWNQETRLGDIFVKLCDYLKCYVEYVNNYNNAITLVAELKETNTKFTKFCKKTEQTKRCKYMPLESFLIMPIQRVPRYVMLLADLKKHTWPDHADYEDLSKSLVKMQDIAGYINEKKRESESMSTV